MRSNHWAMRAWWTGRCSLAVYIPSHAKSCRKFGFRGRSHHWGQFGAGTGQHIWRKVKALHKAEAFCRIQNAIRSKVYYIIQFSPEYNQAHILRATVDNWGYAIHSLQLLTMWVDLEVRQFNTLFVKKPALCIDRKGSFSTSVQHDLDGSKIYHSNREVSAFKIMGLEKDLHLSPLSH
jgi:hypothetical protein